MNIFYSSSVSHPWLRVFSFEHLLISHLGRRSDPRKLGMSGAIETFGFPCFSSSACDRSDTISRSRLMRSYYSEVLVTRTSDFFKSHSSLSEYLSSPFFFLFFSFSSCVFYGDLYPNQEGYDETTAKNLTLLIEIRNRFAYGPTIDYPAEQNCIGFVRKGTATHNGCVVVLSNKEERSGFDASSDLP